MGTLIAQHTIQGQRYTGRLDPDDPKSRRLYEPAIIAPGGEFDPAKIGIGEEEAMRLVLTGAARERGALEAAALPATAASDVTLHPPAGGGEADDLPDADELEKMSRADLDALGVQRGLDPSQAKNKAEMIDLLLDSAA
jgi:hypothetical protein